MLATGPALQESRVRRNGSPTSGASIVASPVALRRLTAAVPGKQAPLSQPHTELFRLTDTLVILVVMGAAFLVTNRGSIVDLEQFLALRITMKNALLLVGFLVLWQRIFATANRPTFPGGDWRHGELVQVSAGCSLAAVVAALVPLTGLSRSFGLSAVALFWVTSVPAALAARRVARVAARVVTRAGRTRQVIIVGSGPLAYAAFRNVCSCPDARCQVVGFVDTNDWIPYPEVRERLLGGLSELESILMHRNVDLVLVALPVKSCYSSIQEAIRVCERVGVESRYLADIFRGELARHEYDPDAGMPSVAMKVVHDDVRTLLKRGFDVAAAVAGLLLLAPLLAAIAAAIKLTSPGPVLFAQERYGLNRRIFRMYKFRTMVADAEALQESIEHLNEAAGPVFKIRDDPRVTPLGSLLRRTSLDELPQLLNVVTGDMSLVGPRPLPLRDVRHFSHAALMRRFSVRPGLTGLWQVSGRSELGFDEWIRLDLQYIDDWSIGLDLRILLRTLPAVVRGTGAT
jgi:exopolysaccharide biosynthesis polyprenyl glycosylphosphotransferase